MRPYAADFSLSENLLKEFDRDSFRKEMKLDQHFVITYVGAHGVANHLQQVLEAGKKLEDTNVLFLLIGQGMEKERLKQMAADMKVTNVRFIDSVPKREVFKYILASEMGASVLKKVDTFKTVYSNKTFDYMSCKKPVLMAIDGVSRQLVEEAQCGIYVEPENIEDYNLKIREYLNNPERLEMEGNNGYAFAKQNYDRDVLARKYINEIEQKAFKR
jgi:glycosyltransferase involved in cell wall biosynthesis